MITLVVTVFVASLVGSLHCAGMCGAFLLLSVGGPETGPRPHLALQSAYHGGRLVTYMILGFVAGGLGATLDLTGNVFGLQRAALVAAGAAMIVFGVVILLRRWGVRVAAVPLPAPLRVAAMRGHAFAQRRSPVPRATLIGLLSTLLPCGWLYAFAITAAGTGTAAYGAITMAVFWLGTLPVLVGLGLGAQRIMGPFRRHVPVMTSLALVTVGLVAVLGRFNVPALAASDAIDADAPSSLEAAVERTRELDAGDLPCCPPLP